MKRAATLGIGVLMTLLPTLAFVSGIIGVLAGWGDDPAGFVAGIVYIFVAAVGMYTVGDAVRRQT